MATGRPLLAIVLSALLHGTLTLGVFSLGVTPREKASQKVSVRLVEKPPPEPPKPEPKEPEPPKPEPKEPDQPKPPEPKPEQPKAPEPPPKVEPPPAPEPPPPPKVEPPKPPEPPKETPKPKARPRPKMPGKTPKPTALAPAPAEAKVAAAAPAAPRTLGIKLEGAVTSEAGLAMPTGDGLPTAAAEEGEWTEEPAPLPDNQEESAEAAATVAADAQKLQEKAAASTARQIAKEEAGEWTDAKNAGKNLPSAAQDRKHDAIKTRSVAAVKVLPKVSKPVQPVYPEEVRAQEIEGIVKLELVVSPEGKVLSAKLLKRLHPLLDESAYNAAMAMSFSPATEDGKPVRVKIPWEFVFVLE